MMGFKDCAVDHNNVGTVVQCYVPPILSCHDLHTTTKHSLIDRQKINICTFHTSKKLKVNEANTC